MGGDNTDTHIDVLGYRLNPPRPHGRGQQKFTKIGSAILLPLEEMIKDI